MRVLAVLTLVAALQPAAPVTTERLIQDVGRLVAAETNEARFDALTALLSERKLSFEVERFTLDKPGGKETRTEGRNVVVSFGTGDEHIVVGAHYDAVRLADGSLSRGAVDNGASSVMLVRLAEALRNERLTRRVHIVWFDMEELGLRGSAAYVQRHANRETAAMLNFDINAYGDTVLFGPAGREMNADLQETLLITCAHARINCVAFPEMPPSDDRPFTQRKIPTISIAMLPETELHQLWLLVNAGANSGLANETTPSILQTIHTPGDTLDKVNGESVARALHLALSVVRTLAAQ